MPEHDQVGGCVCGAVRYRMQAPTRWCAHSHQTALRHGHGAAMVTLVGARTDRFAVTDGEEHLTSWDGGEAGVRHFCRICGTPLFVCSQHWPFQVHVTAGTIDGGPWRKPAGHLHVDERPAWVPIDDELPRFGGPFGSTPQGHRSLRERLGALRPDVRLAAVFDLTDLELLYQEYAAEYWKGGAPGTTREGLAQALERKDTCLFVVERDGAVVGFADVKILTATAEKATQAYLEDIYVAPAARRHGCGDALLEVFLECGRLHGACHAFLLGFAKSAEAHAMYEKHGLEATDDRVFERSL